MNTTKAIRQIARNLRIGHKGEAVAGSRVMAALIGEHNITIIQVAHAFCDAADEAGELVSDFAPPEGWVDSQIKYYGNVVREALR